MIPPDAHPSATPVRASGPLVHAHGPMSSPTGRPHLPPALERKFDPWALLQALRHRWLIATVLGLVAATGAVVGAYYFYLEPERKVVAAVAYFWPMERYEIHSAPTETDEERNQRVNFEATLAGSDEVINRAIRDPELDALVDFASLSEPERFAWVKSRLSTAGDDYEKSIYIVLKTFDNERWLAPIANALLKAYVALSNEVELESRQKFYNDRHRLYVKYGGDKDERLQKLKEKQRKMTVDEGQRLLIAKVQDLEGKRDQLEVDIFEIDIDIEVEKTTLGTTSVSAGEVMAELDKDEDWLALLVLMADLQNQINTKTPYFSDGANNPVIKQLDAALKQTLQEEDAYRTKKVAEIEATLAQMKADDIAKALSHLDLQRKKKVARLNAVMKDLEKSRAQIVHVGDDPSAEIKALEEELKNYPLLGQLRHEIDILKTEKDRQPRVTARMPAFDPPGVEAPPPQTRRIALAGGAALAFVLVGVALLEYRTRRIHTVNEVVQGLGLRLLGAIPTWSPHAQRYGSSLSYNFWTESVDTARTMVTHAARAEEARVVMVTSATSGEGKTSLSSHLASSLARAGHRTLLVDGDLRSPAIHALFGLPLTPGFCEVLRGEVSLEQAIQATPARGLELMTAGQWNGDALQALAQGDTRDIFARLKENYDYVIFDSSPVLAIADALMIGRHVDGVLISILRDVSRVPTVYAAYQRLSMLGIRTLGAVVNGARTERYGSWCNAPPVAAA
jgi:succinoglycan biosynthesis transport protein ExoP